MTLMRAKFERCGEPIPMRVDKRDYLFQENHVGDFVAKVDAEDHVNYLLATENFEIYDQAVGLDTPNKTVVPKGKINKE